MFEKDNMMTVKILVDLMNKFLNNDLFDNTSKKHFNSVARDSFYEYTDFYANLYKDYYYSTSGSPDLMSTISIINKDDEKIVFSYGIFNTEGILLIHLS